MKHLLFILLLTPSFLFAQLTGDEKNGDIPSGVYTDALVTDVNSVDVYDVNVRLIQVYYIDGNNTQQIRNIKFSDLNSNKQDISGHPITNKFFIKELKYVRTGTVTLNEDQQDILDSVGEVWVKKDEVN